MTVDTYLAALKGIVDDAYAQDSSIRHDPFWKRVNLFCQRAQSLVDKAKDKAMAKEITRQLFNAHQCAQMGPDDLACHYEDKATSPQTP